MDTIDYIFMFSQKGNAQSDSIVGPYFVPNSGLSSDVLIYDRAVDSTISLPNYHVMITSTAPLNGAFLSHPNIELVINRALFWNDFVDPNVILNNTGRAAANFSITISGIGVYVVSGLIEAVAAVFPTNGYITEDASQFYITEDSSSIYVTET